MEVSNGGRAANNIASNFQSIVECRRRSEAESTNGGGVATHNDDLSAMLKRMAAPVPHVERVNAVVRISCAVQVLVPLVFSKLLFKACL